VRYYIEYIFARILEFILLCLPRRISFFISMIFVQILKIFLCSRRNLVLKNLNKVFPEKSYKEKTKIANAVWENMAKNVVEFIRIKKLNRKNYEKFIEFENETFLKEAIGKNKGVLLLTAHIGNWELMGAGLSLRGYKIMVIARKLKNKLVDREINRIREFSGEKVVQEHSAVKESLRWLNKGGCIGILIDQHITEGGVVVDFLGRPAATSSIIALLAKKTGAIVLPIYNIRLPSGRIKVIFERSYEINPSDDVYKQTEKMSEIIGSWVRKFPEQWFWLHNRWKV